MKGFDETMEYAYLGKTDLKVSKICVAGMSFGQPQTMHDWTLDKSQTEQVVQHALALGFNFLILLMVILPVPAKNI